MSSALCGSTIVQQDQSIPNNISLMQVVEIPSAIMDDSKLAFAMRSEGTTSPVSLTSRRTYRPEFSKTTLRPTSSCLLTEDN